MSEKTTSKINYGDILRRYAFVIAAAVLFVLIQMPVFKNWWKIWMEGESYYSHGPLVPLIALFMAWTNKPKLAKVKPSGSYWGLVLLLLSIPVYCVALLMELRFLYGVSFLVMTFGISLMMVGWKPTLILAIPILFLITMMPIMSWLLDKWTLHLQIISAGLSTKFLQWTATPDAYQSGSYIHSPAFPNGTLLVGVPCSGLKLLISLITFSWFFIYIIKGTTVRKTILFLFSLPLSIFINALRITMIGYAGIWSGSQKVMTAFHDWSGYLSLIICFFILFGVAKLMGMRDFKSWEVDPADAAEKNWNTIVGKTPTGYCALIVLLIILCLAPLLKPIYNFPKGKLPRESIPYEIGTWKSSESEIGEKTRAILGMGDLHSLFYRSDDYPINPVSVFLDASYDISAFHDPHYCLPGNGTPITEDKHIVIEVSKPRPMKIHATKLTLSADYLDYLVIYFYTMGDETYPTTDQMATRNRQNKKEDLVRLVTNPACVPQLRKDVLKRQFMWYRFSTGMVDETAEDTLIQFIKDYIEHSPYFGIPVNL